VSSGLTAAALAAAFAIGCGPNPKATETRGWSDHYAFRISVKPMPPKSEQDNFYRIVVQDKKTGQPIEGGEGRIFATNASGANVDDGLRKEKELGTYSARLRFLVGGDWPIAIQFRRDHNQATPLERIDWIQSVQSDTTIGPDSTHR
jgi:hypothetical protein